MRIAATIAPKPAATEPDNSTKITPSVKEARHTRTHSFASPATHERIEVEVEIEIDFPVQGVGQAVLAPLNLRYNTYALSTWRSQSELQYRDLFL